MVFRPRFPAERAGVGRPDRSLAVRGCHEAGGISNVMSITVEKRGRHLKEMVTLCYTAVPQIEHN